MYGRSVFSHNQLHKKSCQEIRQMLSEINKDWEIDLKPVHKNGTLLVKNLQTGQIEIQQEFDSSYNGLHDILFPLIQCDEFKEAENRVK